jgi:maltose alpha-D-glucosyltransferase / alpha-amylase
MTVNLEEKAPLNAAGWDAIFHGRNRDRLEKEDLPGFLVKQRWFAGKAQIIHSVRVADWAILVEAPHGVLSLVEVEFESGLSEMYVVPLAISFNQPGKQLAGTPAKGLIAPLVSGQTTGVLHDGVLDDQVCLALLRIIEHEDQLGGWGGVIRGERGTAFPAILGGVQDPLPVRRGSAEQSNTSILYGDRFILKLFRRPEVGENPDCEIGRYLTENTSFERIPPFAGMLRYRDKTQEEPRTLAMLQGLVKNQGDGWSWTLEQLDRYYDVCSKEAFPVNAKHELANPALETSQAPLSPLIRNYVGEYPDSAALLGRRTAELHLALAQATHDKRFRPQPLTRHDGEILLTGMREHGAAVFRLLEEQARKLSPDIQQIAGLVLSQREHILDRFTRAQSGEWRSQRTRIHGDYHLGQVLRTQDDFVILDFEGEPARALAERRQKQSPLKDVAGMLRSFSYAAYAGLIHFSERGARPVSELVNWAELWERAAIGGFLHSYWQTASQGESSPETEADFGKLLKVFLLDKALYEVRYELNSRPAWVRIPLLGILSLE